MRSSEKLFQKGARSSVAITQVEENGTGPLTFVDADAVSETQLVVELVILGCVFRKER